MRRRSALLAVALTAASLTAVATASTPTGSTVTMPRTGSVTATWSGSAGPGVDSGGCSTDVPVTDDHYALTVKVPSGLYDTVTTETTLTIKAANDLDLEVRDAAGGVVA
ncbi:MAG: hypothetical protein ABR549_05995, partial [Mycobacteriales bacterium]